MIENNLLHILITFKQCGTLSKTAEELNISQPALSRSMQKLEDEMNIPLFIRGKNSLKLNENGELLVLEAKKLLDNQTRVIEKVRQFDASNRNIKIGYSAPGPKLIYESIIQSIYPNSNISWNLNFNEQELIHQLKEHVYDFIFIEQQNIPSSFYSKLCLKEHLKICVLPSNPFAQNKSVTFKEIDGQTFLQLSSIGVWSNFVKNKLSKSRIIKQDNREDLTTLINNSPFSCFVTNLTNLDTIKKYTDRIIIPISDKDATKNFLFVTTNKKRFINLIQKINDTKNL